MADYTDARLRELEAFLQNLYKDAEADLRRKWDEFMASREKKAEKYREAIAKATTPKAKAAAEKKYKKYLTSTTAGDARYRAMVEETARQYAAVTERAQGIINDERSAFFADGYNFAVGEVNDVAVCENIGVRFDITSKEAIDRLAWETLQDRVMMPDPQDLDISADERWNAKLINSQVAQGIVQGESIPKIAKRLTAVTDGVVSACVRRARTMATSCQNAGRVDAMKNAENLGVKTRKKWLCTHDGRTRDSHLDIDGEAVEPNAYFSNRCRYPGDPFGPSKEVWNCRCTLITVVDGFSSNLPKGKEGAITVEMNGKIIKQGDTSAWSKLRRLRTAKPAQEMTSAELKEIGHAFYESDEYRKAVEKAKADFEAAIAEAERRAVETNDAYDALRAEIERKFDDGVSVEEHRRLIETRKKAREECVKAFKELNRIRAETFTAKETVSRLIAEARGEGRGFASTAQKNEHLQGARTAQVRAVAAAYSRYPASWVQASANVGAITVTKSSRGYYQDQGHVMAIGGNLTEYRENNAVHEIAHRMERVMGLIEAERRFYEERTAGESAEWLGGNYDASEVTRRDNFVNAYIGKDYGGRAYELVSMGTEGIIGFTDNVDLSYDEDMRDWITGILLAY